MGGRRATFINISSIDGLRPARSYRIYGIAKATVISLTRGLAWDLGPYGIRVNAIAPGYVRVPVGVVNREDEVATYDDPEMLERIPLGRIAQPVDIATVALFLASETSNYITGQTIVMDGGVTA